MREIALEVLAEPGTGAALDVEILRRDGEEILEGVLVSKETGARFPIRGGIPRFGASPTVGAAPATGSARASELEARTGIPRVALAGKWCVDVGCGDGRWAAVAAEAGAHVVALSDREGLESLAEARAAGITFVQADLLKPPVRPGTFDVAWSFDTIQSSPDPARAAHLTVTAAKDGGRFALSVGAPDRWAHLAERAMRTPGLSYADRLGMALTWRKVDFVLRAAGAQSWRFSKKAPVVVSGIR